MCNVCTCTRPGCITCGYGLASHPHTRGIDHTGQEYPKGSLGYIDQICLSCDAKLSRHTNIERTLVNWDGTPLPVEPNDNLSDAQRLAMLSLAVAEFLFGDLADSFAQHSAIIRLRQQYRKHGKQD